MFNAKAELRKWFYITCNIKDRQKNGRHDAAVAAFTTNFEGFSASVYWVLEKTDKLFTFLGYEQGRESNVRSLFNL